MSPSVKAFNDYRALKLHFSGPYDYFKYQGKVRSASLEKRNDRYYFQKLGQLSDYFDFLVANCAYETALPPVVDLFKELRYQHNFEKYKKIRQSISYIFLQDCQKLKSNFNDNFVVDKSKFPYIITQYLQKEIELETVAILCSVTGCLDDFDKSIEDTIVWPKISKRIRKYMPFVKYDREKIIEIIRKNFS